MEVSLVSLRFKQNNDIRWTCLHWKRSGLRIKQPQEISTSQDQMSFQENKVMVLQLQHWQPAPAIAVGSQLNLEHFSSLLSNSVDLNFYHLTQKGHCREKDFRNSKRLFTLTDASWCNLFTAYTPLLFTVDSWRTRNLLTSYGLSWGRCAYIAPSAISSWQVGPCPWCLSCFWECCRLYWIHSPRPRSVKCLEVMWPIARY